MKKVVGFVVILFVIGLVYQYFVILLEDSFVNSYVIDEFTITEEYVKDDVDGYYITITNSDKEFNFFTYNNYNKQKQIISDIEYMESDDYLCIYPISINNDKEFEIICSDGNSEYSYEYLKDEIVFTSFIEELGLITYFEDNTSLTITDNNQVYYTDNIYDNEYIAIYRYKYLSNYHQEIISNFDFSTSDIYKNELGVYLNNYFVIPNYEDNDIVSYYVYNMTTDKTSEIKCNLSKNIYNLGVVDDKLYVFDLDSKVEYKIDVEKEKIEEIGNTSDGFTFYENGKWISKVVSEFTKNKSTFSYENVELDFDYDDIYEEDNAYYLVEDNYIYKVYKNNLDSRILLLELSDYDNLVISHNGIYYIKDEYVYRYDKYGVKHLVKNNEFKYNSFNILGVYWEE